MKVDLRALLDSVDDDVKDVLVKNSEVTDREELDADDLPDATGEVWYRVPDVVAVFIDLQASTKLSVGKHPASTAAIYRAAMKNAVKILHDFEADFIQVQGDGAFGLFWSDRPVERGICAGITAKTFSERSLEPRLEARWPDAPKTGFKVGVAQGSVLVKKVGTPRNPNEQEPTWAGKPVNYAAKAAQQADRGELIVTGGVWLAIEGNDYLTVSCGHGTDVSGDLSVLWEDVEIEKLTHDSDDAAGRLLKSCWCTQCGPRFVTAILAGERVRPETDEVFSKSLDESVALSMASCCRKARRVYWWVEPLLALSGSRTPPQWPDVSVHPWCMLPFWADGRVRSPALTLSSPSRLHARPPPDAATSGSTSGLRNLRRVDSRPRERQGWIVHSGCSVSRRTPATHTTSPCVGFVGDHHSRGFANYSPTPCVLSGLRIGSTHKPMRRR